MQKLWVWGRGDWDFYKTHDSAQEALEHWRECEQPGGVVLTEVFADPQAVLSQDDLKPTGIEISYTREEAALALLDGIEEDSDG